MTIKLPTAHIGIRSIFTRALLLAIMFSMLLTNASVYARTAAEQRLVNYDKQYLDYSGLGECTSSGTVSNVDNFLRALALQESSGNPTAQNPASSASGKYQYIDGTWNSHAKLYYKPAVQFVHAKDAPEEVQDALAYIEYTVKFNTYKGDSVALAISHFGGEGIAKDSSLWDTPAPGANAGLTYRQYAINFMEKAGTPEAQAIPLKYTQAKDFQKYLSEAGVNVSAGSAATNGCNGGTQIGDFVLYLQFDPKWAGHRYGDSTIGPTGCGPTSLAMVVATLGDKSVTPPQVADWSTQNGHVRPGVPPNGGGSAWSLFSEGAAHWNLKTQRLFATNDSRDNPSRPSSADVDAVIKVLKSGGLVIASGTGPIPFTSGGHILVIRGVDESGKWLLGDPGHNRVYGPNIPNPNDHAYEPSELTPYIRGLWGVTK